MRKARSAFINVMPGPCRGKLSIRNANNLINKITYYSRNNKRFAVDLRRILFWDVSALLWLSLGIKDFIDDGIDIKLILPDTDEGVSVRYGCIKRELSHDIIESAQFLKSYKYDLVLRRMGGVEKILVPEQNNYFMEELYTSNDSKRIGLRKFLHESNDCPKLLRMFDFVSYERITSYRKDKGVSGDKQQGCLKISKSLINGRVNTINDAIDSGKFEEECKFAVGMPARQFTRIVSEALCNMQQHKEASIGLMAIHSSLNSKKIRIVVIDDGESICSSVAVNDSERVRHGKHKSTLIQSAKILDYLTAPEYIFNNCESSTGLYYLKRDALESFGGKMQIVTSDVSCTYSGKDLSAFPSYERVQYRKKGNLLVIEVPAGD